MILRNVVCKLLQWCVPQKFLQTSSRRFSVFHNAVFSTQTSKQGRGRTKNLLPTKGIKGKNRARHNKSGLTVHPQLLSKKIQMALWIGIWVGNHHHPHSFLHFKGTTVPLTTTACTHHNLNKNRYNFNSSIATCYERRAFHRCSLHATYPMLSPS